MVSTMLGAVILLLLLGFVLGLLRVLRQPER